MQIERNGSVLTVSVTPKFLLDQFISGRFGLVDVDYICVMMYQLGIGRISKKKATEIPIDINFGNRINIVQSVNMCLELLGTAGMSLKGISRFRQHARDNCGIEFFGFRATNLKFQYSRRHICLDVIDEFDSTRPLYKRAMERGRQFIEQNLGIGVPTYTTGSILRIGLLALADEADPELVLTNYFDLSI